MPRPVPGSLPRGIGCDVSGTIDAVGDGVTDVKIGDVVFGTADWAHCSSAGASDQAVMNRWFRDPDGLDLVQAAALPMTVDTAFWHLNALGFDPEKTILIHGAGTTIGFAAVQIALLHGMRVLATAGETYAQRLRALGAQVTAYGDGMVERVTEISGGPADLVLNTAPGRRFAGLVQIAGDDPKRVPPFPISPLPLSSVSATRSTRTAATRWRRYRSSGSSPPTGRSRSRSRPPFPWMNGRPR